MRNLRLLLRDCCRSDASDGLDVGVGSSLSSFGISNLYRNAFGEVFVDSEASESINSSSAWWSRISISLVDVLLHNLPNRTCVLLSVAFICNVLLGTVKFCTGLAVLVSIRRRRILFFQDTSVTVPLTYHIATVGRSSERRWFRYRRRFWVLDGSSLILFWNAFDKPFQVIPKGLRQERRCWSDTILLFPLHVPVHSGIFWYAA
jgi:hypothetical protein